jgi:ATP-dependent DNA helicase DinG
MKRYFSDNAMQQMQDAIRDAGGNEVFFLGRTDEALVVVETEVLARGNRDTVAAIMIAASFGDVVIHNHPSGELTPSAPDIEIASMLGNQGVGFYIVDNRAERCYQVVAPFVLPTRQSLSYPELERWYAPDGVLGKNLKGYEHREEQVRMAFAVAEAFNGDRVALIEAGTGTGKSLAYLLPAILWALRNRERVVISTNTINLQEQLTRKDIPFIQQQAGIEFRAVLVKGRNNYLCRRKLEIVKVEPALFKDEHVEEIDALIAWSESTSDGCRSDLSFVPRDETWEEVCCEADQCNRVKCPHYARCFFYAARRAAAGADILVVNHALLMADVAVRQETGYASTAVLPPFHRIIFDEGHHLEDVATSYLANQVTRNGLLKILGRLQHPRRHQRGILPQISTILSRDLPDDMDDLYMEAASILEGRLIPRRSTLVDKVSRGMDAIGFGLGEHMKQGDKRSGEIKLRVTPGVSATEFWREVEGRIDELAVAFTEYAHDIKEFFRVCDKLPAAVQERMSSLLIDLRGIRGRMEGVVADLRFFGAGENDYCRWFEVKRGGKGMTVRLCAAPLEVAESIKKAILDKFRTVVLTSATLAVAERFDFLAQRTGIGMLERSRVTELLLASPFDYAKQAFVGIPEEMPEPGTPLFEKGLRDILLRAISISGGHAFVLFTSYDLLSRTYQNLAGPLGELGCTPLRQGEIGRHLLLSRFKKERNAVLFGTDSFWEGVDVKGRALELVVITRLPFRVPTEPVLEARAEHIEANGKDPFMEYTIPQAVLKFKQGFGRLIRSRTDRGAVLILDSRVVHRNYGRFFLDSLPPVRLVRGDGVRVMGEMEGFFSSSPSSPA